MITLKTKIGYGIGDLANNLMFQLSVLYLLYFFTDVAGIAPGVVGAIFLGARIWDAVNDPMMGMLIDRTESKHGRSRVYLRYASLPLALATILLFRVPEISATGKTIYAAVTYLVWGMLYTMISIPYASMTAELTGDSQERTSLSSVRMLFMLGGVIIVSVATEPLTGFFQNLKTGYFYTAIIYSAIAFIIFQVCFMATGRPMREAGLENGKRKKSTYGIAETFRIVSKNKQLMILTIAFLLGATAEYIREASVIYFVSYNMGNSSLVPIFMGIVVLSMIIANLLIPEATKRFDKKGTYMIGTVIAIAGSLIFHFIPHTNLVAVLVMAAISSFGFTVVSTLGWAMLPDTVEYGEALTGVRSEGVIYSFFSFSQKLATALAGGIAAWTLQFTGYVAQSSTQTPLALSGILSTLTFIPIIFIALSAVILHFYNIDKKKFDEIRAELIKKNN
ncbi:MAG: MFS transporter [Spirochaetales bacterium]|nr:MFS transporter [Spirochaetales bacterium]